MDMSVVIGLARSRAYVFTVCTCLRVVRVRCVWVSRVKDWSATEMKDLPKGTESIECELWRYPQFLGSIIFVCLR